MADATRWRLTGTIESPSGATIVGGRIFPRLLKTYIDSTTGTTIAGVEAVPDEGIPFTNGNIDIMLPKNQLIALTVMLEYGNAIYGRLYKLIPARTVDGTIASVVGTWDTDPAVLYSGAHLLTSVEVDAATTKIANDLEAMDAKVTSANTNLDTKITQAKSDLDAKVVGFFKPVTTVYSTPGTFNVALPAGATSLSILAIGAGGGGGSGGRGPAGSAVSGGGGGGGGGITTVRDIPLAGWDAAGVTVVVPAGGAGAAPTATDSTGGTAGAAGGFATAYRRSDAMYLAVAYGGNAGGAPIGGTAGQGSAFASAGGLGGSGAGGASERTGYAPTGGGAGGGISSVSVTSAGGASGSIWGRTIASGAAGGDAGQPGKSPTIQSPLAAMPSAGGSGGGSSATGPGGKGGDGGLYGGGGGGGGASANGFASGAGGKGGDGVVVLTWR